LNILDCGFELGATAFSGVVLLKFWLSLWLLLPLLVFFSSRLSWWTAAVGQRAFVSGL